MDKPAILGGTSTNCAGGELPFKKWMTGEEVVKRQPNGKKHGCNEQPPRPRTPGAEGRTRILRVSGLKFSYKPTNPAGQRITGVTLPDGATESTATRPTP